MRKITFLILSVIVLTTVLVILGPYLRDQKYPQVIQLHAMPATYDCAGESCIGFIIKQVNLDGFDQFQGKFILPYSDEFNNEQLQNKWAHFLNHPEKMVCIKGVLHRFSVSTLRPFHPSHGSYRILLNSFDEGGCQKSSP